jgi:hypothetical protein
MLILRLWLPVHFYKSLVGLAYAIPWIVFLRCSQLGFAYGRGLTIPHSSAGGKAAPETDGQGPGSKSYKRRVSTAVSQKKGIDFVQFSIAAYPQRTLSSPPSRAPPYASSKPQFGTFTDVAVHLRTLERRVAARIPQQQSPRPPRCQLLPFSHHGTTGSRFADRGLRCGSGKKRGAEPHTNGSRR